MSDSAQDNRKPVNLALQGGGAHGAFTWGVLDRLLEDGRLSIEAISGTSAGAMNAVVVAEGMMRDGNDGARECLETFWRRISEAAHFSPIKRAPLDMLMGNWGLDTSPSYMAFDLLSRLASPYDLNPLNLNPVRDLLDEIIDFDKVRACDAFNLFISATNVQTGRVKVFRRDEISADAVMASACLPFLFQAVEIDGVPYWDGGYMGNPALFPFFNSSASRDVVIVQINPIFRQETPRTAREIQNRMNEITFNASLLREYRAIEFVSRLVEDGLLDPEQYKQVLVHRVVGDTYLAPLTASSKMNAEWPFLRRLFETGRACAADWLEENFEAIGTRSTVDLKSLFQGHEA